MADAPLMLAFDEAACRDVGLTGGKGASLATMAQEGLPVPPGFVVTAPAFAAAVDTARLLELVHAGDLGAIRALVAATKPPVELVREHYGRLPRGAVAVRSSACAEDSGDASYAGQQETYLFVDDFADVVRRIVDCWLSFFSERAVFYRLHKGSLDDLAMAVVVQRMVDAEKAGVMFTVDPVNGRRDRLIVEAAKGVGEQVVSGGVTPDYYALDRGGAVKKKRLAGEQVMTDAELAELARLGRKLAELHGCPQDVEWAYDGTGLHMLQSRPVTTV